MTGLEFVRTYIDDLLVITTGSFQEHPKGLETVLNRLTEAGLKINASKSFFARTELEYLGFWLSREGIQPLPKKVEAIMKIAPLKNKKRVKTFHRND